MRYEDYKVEDMVFTTKEDWTEEEMREFLDTCPECKGNAASVAALNELLEAIENNGIKLNAYHEINRGSAKAYVKKHTGIYYGYCGCYRGDNMYVIIDGEKREINTSWNVKDLLKDINNIQWRFNRLAHKYKAQEEKYVTEKETTEYKKVNKDQIIASRMADEWLADFKLEVPVNVYERTWIRDDLPKYESEMKKFNGWDFRFHNKYDELTFYNEPITKEEAEKIISVIQEASRKVSLIIDRCQVELQEIKESHRKEN